MSAKKLSTAKATETTENTLKATENTTENESKYSISELAENQKMFETDDVVIKTALMLGGKKEYTLSEAKRLVNEFKTKEVKK